jgi:hypothetical protein
VLVFIHAELETLERADKQALKTIWHIAGLRPVTSAAVDAELQLTRYQNVDIGSKWVAALLASPLHFEFRPLCASRMMHRVPERIIDTTMCWRIAC